MKRSQNFSHESMAQRPTIIDVARHAGVSKSTVSRVLQGDGPVSQQSQEAVWQAIAVLGYEQNAVASSLRTDRTWTIMLATPDITNPFWATVARGVQDTMEAAGYSVVLANSDWDANRERLFLRTARRNRFDAILINPTAVSGQELLATGVPVVLLGMPILIAVCNWRSIICMRWAIAASALFVGNTRVAVVWRASGPIRIFCSNTTCRSSRR